MSQWGWSARRGSDGIWDYGSPWFRTMAKLSPWLSAGLCLFLLHLAGGRIALSDGVLFDLPDSEASEVEIEPSSVVAMVIPQNGETAVFFDDARYPLDDGSAVAVFAQRLKEVLRQSESKTLTVLADRRVNCDELVTLASLAGKSGAKRVLFANKSRKEPGN